MAYTIISQNNTTTTLSDENGNVITVPARVTLATSTDYTIKKVNNNSVDLEDGDGKIIRGVPACVVLAGEGGGGGGSVSSVNGQTGDVTLTASDVSALPTAGGTMTGAINMEHQDITFKDLANNTVTLGYGGQVKGIAVNGDIVLANGKVYSKGFGLTRESGNATYPWAKTYTKNINNGADITVPTTGGTMAVQVSSLPTASSTLEGQVYQYIGATDSTYTHGYIYECKAQGTDPETYAWEAVEVQASSGGLPSQTGNAGKFLTTDGTDASWGNAIANDSTVNTSVVVTGTADTTHGNGVAIGKTAKLGNYSSVAIGYGADANSSQNYGIAIGDSAKVNGTSAVAIGYRVSAGAYGVAIGNYADGTSSASYSIAIRGKATAQNAIQLGAGTNADQYTFKVGWGSSANYTLLEWDVNTRTATIPTARLADTTNAAQGQVLTLDSNLNAVWQAGGGGSSYTAGTGIDITNDVISVTAPTLVNKANFSDSAIQINPTATSGMSGSNAIAIGIGSRIGAGGVAIGNSISSNTGYLSTTVGNNISNTPGYGSINLGNSVTSTAGTLSVALSNQNPDYSVSTDTYILLNRDGTIPAARHASLPATDGTYVLKLVIASGVPTLSWVAE